MSFSLRAWVRSLSAPASPIRKHRPRLELLEDRQVPALFIVTTASDAAGHAGTSLRDAITSVDASTDATNAIDFQIGTAGSVQTINLASDLPTLAKQVLIDGWSQSQMGGGYSGPPLIVLNGSTTGQNVDGLDFSGGSDGSTVRGLAIQSFGGNGISITANSVGLYGNSIGTDLAGTAKLGNTGGGVYINSGFGNTVGGAGAGNLISGNGNNGVEIARSSGNVVLGNKIGTDINGTAALGNAADGVIIDNGSTNNTVGGTATGAGNLISGNGNNGIDIQDTGTSGNVVLRDLIGTDAAGTAALGNFYGVSIADGATANTVGGVGAGNVVSGNAQDGVAIIGFLLAATGNVLLGNPIGTDGSGTAVLGNGRDGVAIFAAANNTLGGTAAGAGNVVSGNAAVGVEISGSAATGNARARQPDRHRRRRHGQARQRRGRAVDLRHCVGHHGRRHVRGGRNVISGNGGDGVAIGTGASGMWCSGNRIGTDAAGTAALGNAIDGVFVSESSNTVGGTASGAGNVVSGNGVNGVAIGTFTPRTSCWATRSAPTRPARPRSAMPSTAYSSTPGRRPTRSAATSSAGNRNGVEVLERRRATWSSATGSAPTPPARPTLGNANDGVVVGNGATDNTLGGTVGGRQRHLRQPSVGVEIADAGTSGNVVLGNEVGTDLTARPTWATPETAC